MTPRTPPPDVAAIVRELSKVARLRPRTAAVREALAACLRAADPDNDTADAAPVDPFNGGPLW